MIDESQSLAKKLCSARISEFMDICQALITNKSPNKTNFTNILGIGAKCPLLLTKFRLEAMFVGHYFSKL